MSNDRQRPIFLPDYIQVPYQLIADRDLEPMDRMLYGVIYWYEHMKDGECFASNQTLAAILFSTTRAIQNSLNALEAKGYIERQFKDKAHRNRSRILAKIAFKLMKNGERTVGDRHQTSEVAVIARAKSRSLDERTVGDQNKIRDIKEVPDTTAQSAEEKDIGEIIFLFKAVNPSYKILYNRKPQREAARRLLQQFGMHKLTPMIQYLPTSNASRYAPTITTPVEMESSLGRLVAWAEKQRDVRSGKGKKIIRTT